MNYRIRSIFAMLALLGSCSALAEVSADEAKRLGTTLTPWGAEKAGNKEGTIPPYTGEGVPVPASYDPSKPGVLTDPYSNEKPLFSIDAKNMAQYADKVSDGMKAMMARYPHVHMDVYPTHRTVTYPKFYIDNTLKNATQCKLVGERLENCVGGMPFPIPKTGEQAMWDKKLQFAGVSFKSRSSSTVVDGSGRTIVMGVNNFWMDYPYYKPENTGNNTPMYWRFRWDYQEPPRVSGEKILFHLMADGDHYLTWQYFPGQRRTKLAPDLVYDTPHPQAGGVAGMDQSFGFMGALDRFDWKLVGKKEMYIPYNNYQLFSPECTVEKYFKPGYPNPACIRWELHRVVVVEGTLKQGKHHIFSRRVGYFDEDHYGPGVVDYYDMSGKIYRLTTQFGIPSYHDKALGGMSYLSYMQYDLPSGRYLMDSVISPYPPINGYAITSFSLPEREWQPDALAGGGVR